MDEPAQNPRRDGRLIAFGSLAVALVGVAAITLFALRRDSAGATGPVTFVAFGDAGQGTQAQLAVRDRLRADASDYTFALSLGDGAYQDGSVRDYRDRFFAVYGNLFQAQGKEPRTTPTNALPKAVYPTLGDHDTTDGARGYLASFKLPDDGPVGVPAGRFYSFDENDVHFVSFDSTYVAGSGVIAPQTQVDSIQRWLTNDLDGHFDQVTVVFDHDAAYSSGPNRAEPATRAMRQTWFPLFAKHGVDLFLSAHDHLYHRATPQGGLTSYVAGTGGSTLDAPLKQPYTAAEVSDYGYLAVRVDRCRISTAFVLANGRRFDPWTFNAPTCQASRPSGALESGASSPNGATFSDDFETGDFRRWSGTAIRTGPNGRDIVQSSVVKSGRYAASLSATSSGGSYAYARKALGGPLANVGVSGDFQVRDEGDPNGNVPLIKLFAADGTTKVVSIIRQNQKKGALYVSFAGGFHLLLGSLPLKTWVHIDLSVEVRGDRSVVDVALNGVPAYRTSSAALGDQGVATVQIGNEVPNQAFELVVDNIATSDAPLHATSQSFNFQDDFEQGDLRGWTTSVSNGGTVTAASGSGDSGTWAMRIVSPGTPGSIAYARHPLVPAQRKVRVHLAVNIVSEGRPQANVPLLRLFDDAGQRVLSVYRQNQISDRLYVAYGKGIVELTARLPLRTWTEVDLVATASGGTSQIELRVGNTVVYSTNTATLGTRPFAAVQVGNEAQAQQMRLLIDDVQIG
jgi:hypothetical protein